ncbi:MAG: FG-GAP repeat domain-containing protein [Prevotella sp.]
MTYWNKLFAMLALATCSVAANAQYPKDNPADDNYRTAGFPKLKTLKMTDIPGAPILSQPVRIDGSEMEIRTAKHGLCYPAIYDWNGDGKPDLLLGEFSTGDRENNVKVYLNKGTKKQPKFTGQYFYALDTKGDTISSKQWCCIGMHPRMVDITGDGRLDMLSGEYCPGRVGLWRGTDKGFAPLEYVEQEGYRDKNYPSVDATSPESLPYWNYTSAHFADFDGDGLLDLFVGGTAGMRVAHNEGTKEKPKFGLRKYLRFIDGSIITIDGKGETVEGKQPRNMKTYMTPVDWDQDGVLDLLVTYEYARKGDYPVLFYRGVRTNLGLRFERPVPLFTAADGSKALPGCQPMITVADLNSDGVNDIIMGIAVPTIATVEEPLSSKRSVAEEVAWQWTHDMGIQMPGKDAGEYYMYQTFEQLLERVKKSPQGDKGYYLGRLQDPKYLTMRHRGYVLVFYGKKNTQKAVPVPEMTLEKPKPAPTNSFADASPDEPLTYRIEQQKEENQGSWKLAIYLKFKEGWHGFVDSPATTSQGMIPTTVTVETDEGLLHNGMMSKPYVGESTMYFGEVKFTQYLFRQKSDASTKVKIKISYQSCNDSMCLPPAEHVIEYDLEP